MDSYVESMKFVRCSRWYPHRLLPTQRQACQWDREGETIEVKLATVYVFHVVEVRSYTVDLQTETAPNADMIAP